MKRIVLGLFLGFIIAFGLKNVQSPSLHPSPHSKKGHKKMAPPHSTFTPKPLFKRTSHTTSQRTDRKKRAYRHAPLHALKTHRPKKVQESLKKESSQKKSFQTGPKKIEYKESSKKDKKKNPQITASKRQEATRFPHPRQKKSLQTFPHPAISPATSNPQSLTRVSPSPPTSSLSRFPKLRSSAKDLSYWRALILEEKDRNAIDEFVSLIKKGQVSKKDFQTILSSMLKDTSLESEAFNILSQNPSWLSFTVLSEQIKRQPEKQILNDLLSHYQSLDNISFLLEVLQKEPSSSFSVNLALRTLQDIENLYAMDENLKKDVLIALDLLQHSLSEEESQNEEEPTEESLDREPYQIAINLISSLEA